ncbi:inositol-polyphosphate 5-phosphatase, putative [Plasmodium relictum]|uniref:Inositol-polyphosphate 5-phosphatase, putative n=1 Tax=Plasmodium relictum TaxID=85471 RepID=A0A1J1HB46_PLARL|nr:inositol-polyphosphate 5-phosphatase, putative [Plasmodium relictum]CRH00816.1 inositol-polyphosphate 5-phosphatase, putative [Plasmodium relictum]
MDNRSSIALKNYYLESHRKYLSIVNIEDNVKNILKIKYTEDINIIREKEYINDNYVIENNNKNKFLFHGCLGIIKAEDINFLVIVSEAEVVCYLFNRAVYRINKFSFVQLNDNNLSRNPNENYEYEIYCLGTNGNLTQVNNNTKKENRKFFCNKKKKQRPNYLDNIFESQNVFFDRCILKYNIFNYYDAYIHKFKNSTLKKDILKTIIYFLHAFNKGPFYFSYYYNLTISLQNHYINESKKIKEMNKEHSHIYNSEENCNISIKNSMNYFNDFKKLKFSEINKEYTWNWKLLDKFAEIDASDFVLFLIHGYVDSKVLHVYNNKIILYLISRKNRNRSGVRFWCRGGNKKGDVANFVETEQIVICKDSKKLNVFSYLLIRGSIPVLWKQQPTLRIRPRIHICSDMNENINILKLHMEKLKNTYGKISITNLINKKFGEKYLGECFEICLKKCNVEHNFTWFDFHREFKKLNFETLQKSLKTVVNDLNNFSYFSFSIPNTLNNLEHEHFSWENVNVHSFQKGIFRVNCIDCLDRTNVFQSFLAKYVLFLQLKSINIKLEQNNKFPYYFFKNAYDEILYRKIWINNANAISKIYSGAGALKNDITQNGKRTVSGLLQDLYYIILRYINNNFLDGYNNDCINIATNENLKYAHIFNIHKGNYNQLIKVLLEFIIIFSASICTKPMQELLKRVYFFSHNFIINSFSHCANYIFFFIRKNFHLFLFPLNQTKYFNFISILAKTSGVMSISFLIFLLFCIYVFFQKKRVLSSPQLDTNI